MNETASPESPWIVDTDDEHFDRDVVQRSMQTPVIVDFWAAWCAPCRMLGPILEKAVVEQDGKVVLVKADTDQTPQAASQFNVQGIPAVFGVAGGEVVDYFSGALPEDQVRDWIEGLLLRSTAVEAESLEETDPAASEAKYRELIAKLPHDSTIQIGLARTLLAQGRTDEASSQIEQLEERGFLEPEAEKVKAALDLQSKTVEDFDGAREAAETNPDDLTLQLRYAEALVGRKEIEQALEICLRIVEKDKKGAGEEARQVMVDVFRVLPDDSELTRTFRRRLSMLLY